MIQYYRLDERISGIIGKDAGLFFNLVVYAIVMENDDANYLPDYAYNHTLFTEGRKAYSHLEVSDFLHNISRDNIIQFQYMLDKARVYGYKNVGFIRSE